MIDTKALKQKILQLAIQGKLVPQNPDDEPASVLLERIRAEKQRLIKEGKIKKDKSDSVIFKGDDNRHYEKIGNNPPVCIEEKLPFEIPDSWSWCKLTSISYSVGTKYNQILSSAVLKEGAIPVVSQSQNLIDGYSNDIERQITILPLIMFGDHTKVVKYIDFPFIIGADGTKFHKPIIVFPKYLYFLMLVYADSIPSRGYARHYSILTAQYLPLPPLAEQERIVKRVEELFAYIDTIDNNQAELEKLYDGLKKRVLDLAIQGKLVPQEPTDEPASVLLEKIRAEKKAKLGKKYVDSFIYKGDDNCYYEHIDGTAEDKPVEVPFDLPDGWEYIRLSDIGELSGGFTPEKTELTDSNGIIPYFKVADMNTKGNEKYLIHTQSYLRHLPLKVFHKNSIVFPKNGGAVLTNKKRILITDSVVDLNTGVFTPSKLLNFDWSFTLFSTIDFRQHYKGTALPTVNNEFMHSILLGLPPLAEQQRIVDKINEIFANL